jgi:hypothetical protein
VSSPFRRAATLLALTAALTACGGSGGGPAATSTPLGPPPPTAAPGALVPGSRLAGDTFTAAIPLDWSAKATTSTAQGVRQTEVDSPKNEAQVILVEYPFAIFPQSDLNASLDDFIATVVQLPTGSASPRAVSPKTHIKVAGEDAVVLAFQDVFKGKPAFTRLAVFKHAGTVYILTLGTAPTMASSYSPALDTVVSTWAWK